MRNAFFQAAAAILLRPLPAPGQQDQSTSGLDGKYLVIKRLLPFFEQSAPAEMVESLRGHLNALNPVVSDNTRRATTSGSIKASSRTSLLRNESRRCLIESIARRLPMNATRSTCSWHCMTLNKGDMRARDFVSKVEDSEIRKQAQAYIDASLAMYSVQKKLTDQALELVHKGDLTHIHKVWVLTECAKILAKTDRQKALDLVDEAATKRDGLMCSDPDLPRALIAVANALKVIDPERVWDATFDAVKAANSAEGFTGEDGELVLKFQSKGQSSVHTNSVPSLISKGSSETWRTRITIERSSWREDFRLKDHAPWRRSRSRGQFWSRRSNEADEHDLGSMSLDWSYWS